jgi:hypothetical protein
VMKVRDREVLMLRTYDSQKIYSYIDCNVSIEGLVVNGLSYINTTKSTCVPQNINISAQ